MALHDSYRMVCPVETMCVRMRSKGSDGEASGMQTQVAAAGAAAAAAVASGSGERVDGRTMSQFRDIHLALGLVTPAAGSAYVELGGTKVVAAVYGPKPSPKAQFSPCALIEVSVNTAPFSGPAERTSFVPSDADEEMGLAVASAVISAVRVDAYPKSMIDVRVLVLEGDGAVRGACVSAASLALAHAGVEMYDLAVGATVAHVEDSLMVDPIRAEADVAKGAVALAYMPNLDEITQYSLDGQFEPAVLAEATHMALDAARKWAELMRDTLKESLAAKATPAKAS